MPKNKKPTVYGPSKTIPGQSLYPADLMKRHLAGTLPPIDLSSKYEHHYDEEGKQISEPLPTEMYELHALAVALRKKQFEAATEHRKQQAEKQRLEIIEEYKKSQTPVEPAPVDKPRQAASVAQAKKPKTTG